MKREGGKTEEAKIEQKGKVNVGEKFCRYTRKQDGKREVHGEKVVISITGYEIGYENRQQSQHLPAADILQMYSDAA